MPNTVSIANENVQAGGVQYPYPPIVSTTNELANFTDTTGSRLGRSGIVATGGVITTGSLGTTKLPVLPSGAATVTLTAAQSGSQCLFDSAAGVVYTLPAPATGLYYDFIVTTTITSNAAKVITSAGTIFLVGAINYGILDTTPGANPGPKFTAANGTTHVSISSNGSTTGGIIGSAFRISNLSATLWYISGIVIASGTISTPFATS